MIRLYQPTPLHKAAAIRIKRGIKLLDEVTPGWFNPINPDTLHVSDRGHCVFSQAKHDFKKGIVQVAEQAVKMGIPVRLLKNEELARITGFVNDSYRVNDIKSKLVGITIDVFYYGFDVDSELRCLTPDGIAYPKWGGSRREAWDVLDKMWKSVVIQKKKGARP